MNDDQLTETANVCRESLLNEWGVEIDLREACEIISGILQEKNIYKVYEANIVTLSEMCNAILANFETRVGHLIGKNLDRKRGTPIDDSYRLRLEETLIICDPE